MDLNRVTIIGRLTRDPEVKTTPNGKTVATVGVATGRTWSDQAGNKQEQTEFHNCVLWGRLAEIVGQYLSKGRQVYMEGRLQTRDWVGQDGAKRYRTEIVVSNMIMLGGPQGSGARSGSTASGGDSVPPPPEEDGPSDEIKVEDIPF